MCSRAERAAWVRGRKRPGSSRSVPGRAARHSAASSRLRSTKNGIQPGDMIAMTAPTGGIASGQGFVVGSLFGVAAKAAAEGEGVEVATRGVYVLPKEPTAVIALGDRVSWDDAAKQIKLPAVGLYPVGIATEAAVNGAAVVRVRLDGVATAAA